MTSRNADGKLAFVGTIALMAFTSGTIASTLDLLDGLNLSGNNQFVMEGDSLVMQMGHRPMLTFDHVPAAEYALGIQFTMRNSNSPHGPQNGQFGMYLPLGEDLVMLWLGGAGGGGNRHASIAGLADEVHGEYTHHMVPPNVPFDDFQAHWAIITVRPEDGNAGISVWIDNEHVIEWRVDDGLSALSNDYSYYPGGTAVGFTNWYGEVLFDHVALTDDVTGPLRGDCNLDGDVDDHDLSLLLVGWEHGPAEWAFGDFNGDQAVDDNDLSHLLANWTGDAVAVPEPATPALWAAGGLALLRRKRRN